MYRAQAQALDAELLQSIGRRAVRDFNGLALRVFAHQLRYNEPYMRYCASLGVTLDAMPKNWEAIPPVPSAAFKEAALCTFDPRNAALVFETSGTTQGVGGKHYMETAALYDAALVAGFSDAMLPDVNEPLRYLLLVPNPAQRPQSSLGYMMRKVADVYGDGGDRWYLDGDLLHVDRFIDDARCTLRERRAVCIAGTAFAFVTLLDELKSRGVGSLPLLRGSRIMETGGFKGRTRVVERADLYKELSSIFEIPEERIVAEYGMTELTSQYYDSTLDAVRIKRAPAWMRPRVVGPEGKTLPQGVVGALVHVDLANRSSCVAIQTEDLGVATDGGIILIGREQGAELRGCSLDAEQLRAIANA
jgi:acyl-CoA synthetase (AMP-forming)/AMP-acid ligase II